jgi:hypothetical protein
MSIIHMDLQFYRLNEFQVQGLRGLSIQIEKLSSIICICF